MNKSNLTALELARDEIELTIDRLRAAAGMLAPVTLATMRATIEERTNTAIMYAAELRETLRDLREWDGSTDALKIIERNIAACLERSAAETADAAALVFADAIPAPLIVRE